MTTLKCWRHGQPCPAFIYRYKKAFNCSTSKMMMIYFIIDAKTRVNTGRQTDGRVDKLHSSLPISVVKKIWSKFASCDRYELCYLFLILFYNFSLYRDCLFFMRNKKLERLKTLCIFKQLLAQFAICQFRIEFLVYTKRWKTWIIN